MEKHRICSVSVASVYPHYVAKANRKGRTKAEVDQILCWLTGHSQATLEDQLARNVNFEDFFAQAPRMNASRSLITGVVCGVRVEDVAEPTMREKSAISTNWSMNSPRGRRWKKFCENSRGLPISCAAYQPPPAPIAFDTYLQ